MHAATAEPAIPTGTVRFTVDGQNYGPPRSLHNEVAQILIPAADAGASYPADYAGGEYYNPSTRTSS